ncbi:MAG: hypothetical protein ACJAVR_002444 [Paracoccaceae bacterium]|jgi:hypothetical protein
MRVLQKSSAVRAKSMPPKSSGPHVGSAINGNKIGSIGPQAREGKITLTPAQVMIILET